MIKKLLKNEWLVFLCTVMLFLALRLPAVHMPYHQDEYKWPLYADSSITAPGTVPHPPLSEFFYTKFPGGVLSFNDFRFIPLMFELLALIPLYFFVRRRFSVGTAQLAVLIFSLSYYGILASLMVDTDGAILPFFLLCSLYLYDSFRLSEGRKKYVWLGALVFSMILGLMVKLSFVLGVGAIICDFCWQERSRIDKKKFFIGLGGIVGFGLLVYGALLLSQHIFPGFSIARGEKYWGTFVHGFSSRNYFQTAIQVFKGLVYSSPALVLLGLVSVGKKFRSEKIRIFQFFIVISLIFYIVVFDFSIGALDRYLEFLVMPLSIIAASIIARVWNERKESEQVEQIKDFPRAYMWWGIAIAGLLVCLNFLTQMVPPQYPKTAWIHYFASLEWNFLFPFSGGSGPTGFYVSFLFIGMTWIVSAVLLSLFYKKKHAGFLLIVLVIGLAYNVVFAEEYLFGKINGNSSRLAEGAVNFIAQDQSIKNVVVYNDVAGYNIRQLGKYERRMYAAPQFEDSYKTFFDGWKGYIMFINIPRIDPNGFYAYYLSTCTRVYEQTDTYITAQVLSCGKE